MHLRLGVGGEKGSKEVRWGLGWLQSEDDGYKRTGKDGRWLWTGILKSATASSGSR